MPELETGAVFAGHRIEGVAGKGGMGVVYRATHLALDHVVALKVISPALAEDERFRRRFGEESRIAVSIRHPNVVPIHHAGEEDGLLFVTMDLIDGTDLRGLLRAQGPLAPEHAAAIVAEVASALDAAHERGLVHRDIKPGNILIEGGAGEHVYLTDFGLARQIEASTGVTATGAFVGTLDYVAPEQIRGDRVDARADVYALGCVLFELLTGNPPFAARDDKVAKMYAHLEEDAPSLRALRPDLPGALDPALRRALAKDPDDRFPSAGDFARAVSAAAAGGVTTEVERSVATGAAAAPAETEEASTAQRPTVAASTGEIDRPTEPGGPGPARAPEQVSSRSGRRGPLLAALGLLGVGAAIAAALVLGGGNDGGSAADPNGSGGGAIGRVNVDGLPVELAHGAGGVWVTSRGSGQLTYIDASSSSQKIGNRFTVGTAPEGVALAAGSVYVAIGGEGAVKRLGFDGQVKATIPGFLKPQGVAFGAGQIWVTDSDADNLVRIDPVRATIEDTTPVGDGPYGIAFDQDAVWVSNRLGGTVSRVPLEGGATETFEVGASPKGVAVAGGFIWVAVTDDGVVKQLRPDGTEVASIEVGEQPRGVAAGFGSVWVALGGDDRVARLDEASGDVIDRIRVGVGPEGIIAGPESVWVANGVDGTVTRIDPGS